jgi:hypothetical protein
MKVESVVTVMLDHGHLIDRRGRPKSLADFERVAPQRLGAHSSRHRQKMGQHLGGDTKRHQRRKMCSQLVQLWYRPAMRWPADASRVVTTADTAKPREAHHHRAEQRRDRMMLPIFDVASSAARRTLRTQNCMISCLRGDDLLPHANQKLLRLGQRQPQAANLSKITAPVELHYVNTPSPEPSAPVSTNRKTHPICIVLPSTDPGRSCRFPRYPPSFWTLPRTVAQPIEINRFSDRHFWHEGYDKAG